ncbi:hypothetical protein PV04_05039 [Phialophora macrospora]|uniref:Transglycosylase SLT domain-containing protein n=1 Tax=Phialophora macrospora TaxID=1851006 RepID=A0A0D2CVH2_9EURO|nr:hypothetical protein PV04_05039 [Phialophora macrospora]
MATTAQTYLAGQGHGPAGPSQHGGANDPHQGDPDESQGGDSGGAHEGEGLPEGTAPIDETYYHCSGPASAFEQEFDPHVCSYDDLFEHFLPTIVQANSAHGDGEEAANMIHEAIQTVSAATGVEDVVLLCMIMQESTGNCFVPTTIDADGQPTGGLLQCSGAAGVDTQGGELTQDIVEHMISVGAQHLKSNLDQAQGNVYEALRLYNSGSVAADGDLSSPNSVGTPSYVNDMANRFHGWISGGN